MRNHHLPWILLLAVTAPAQSAVLLKDIWPGPNDGRTGGTKYTNDYRLHALFTANNGTQGHELWITDGTPAGTRLQTDIWPGPWSSVPNHYMAFGDRFVFTAGFPGAGEELGVTDGTPQGTGLIADFRPGAAHSYALITVRFRDELLVVADDGNGSKVYRTDGTIAGTYLHPVLPAHFNRGMVAGNKLFWLRQAGTVHELWVWDGESAPTAVATVPHLGHHLPLFYACQLGDRLVFQAGSYNTRPIWVSDGTPSGTQQIATAINPGHMVSAGGRFYYVVRPFSGAHTLWTSDGTPGSSTNLPLGGISVREMVPVGDRLFVGAWNWPNGGTMTTMVTDGTWHGTVQLPIAAQRMIAIGNGRIAFLQSDPQHGLELWRTDGTPGGAVRLTDLAPGPASSFDNGPDWRFVGGKLIGWANDGIHGFELYAFDPGAVDHPMGIGCAAGTVPRLTAGDPVLGTSTVLTVASELPLSVGAVAVGLPVATKTFPGGCDVIFDPNILPLVIPLVTDGAGDFASPSLPVPLSPALNGVRLVAQAMIVEQGAPFFGLAVSNGRLLKLGN